MAEDGAKPLRKSPFNLELPADPRRLPAHAHLELRVQQLEQSFAGHKDLEEEKRKFVERAVGGLEDYLRWGNDSRPRDVQEQIRRYIYFVDVDYKKIVAYLRRSESLRGKHLGIVGPGGKTDREGIRGKDLLDDHSAMMAARERRFILGRLRAYLQKHTVEVDRFLDEVIGLVNEFRPRADASLAAEDSNQPSPATMPAAEPVDVARGSAQSPQDSLEELRVPAASGPPQDPSATGAIPGPGQVQQGCEGSPAPCSVEESSRGALPREPELSARETVEYLTKLREPEEIERFLERFVVGKSWGSLKDNQDLAYGVTDHLRSLKLRLACPKDGAPSYLRALGTGGAPEGAFYFEHYTDKRQQSHGGKKRVPPLKVVPAPPDRRRKKSDPS